MLFPLTPMEKVTHPIVLIFPFQCLQTYSVVRPGRKGQYEFSSHLVTRLFSRLTSSFGCHTGTCFLWFMSKSSPGKCWCELFPSISPFTVLSEYFNFIINELKCYWVSKRPSSPKLGVSPKELDMHSYFFPPDTLPSRHVRFEWHLLWDTLLTNKIREVALQEADKNQMVVSDGLRTYVPTMNCSKMYWGI